MRTIRIKLYKFEELTSEAQEKAIEENRYRNVQGSWWENTYEDANMVKLKISSFDIDNRQIDLDFTESATATAKAILEDHGDQTETYIYAKEFLRIRDEISLDDNDLTEAEAIRFRKKMAWAYLQMLKREEEYLMTDEAIKEDIIANDDEFTKDGKLYN